MSLTFSIEMLRFALSLTVALIVGFSPAFPAVAEQPDPSNQPSQTQIKTEIVVSDLDDPSDFSISHDGQTIFIAEPASQQIRRIKGDSNDVIISGIEHNDDVANAISVFCIDDNHILVGVAGFTSPKHALTLFDLSSNKKFPLDFIDDWVVPTRNFQRRINESDAFDVLKLFEQQRGVSFVRKSDGDALSLCEVQLKNGELEKLSDEQSRTENVSVSELATLAVDPLGGYYVTRSTSQDGTSRLIFSQAEGTVMQWFPLNLPRVSSLAFSPQSQQLYALVVPADNVDREDASMKAGIYEIVADGENCVTELVLPVDRPRTMKIDAQGNAWVLCETDGEKFCLLKVSEFSRSIAE